MGNRTDFFTTKTAAEIVKHLDGIAYHEGPRSRVFGDFLDISIACLAGETLEPLYLSAIQRYVSGPRKDRHMEAFAKSFAALATSEEIDPLGDLFQGGITWGEHGQFFTPYPVCEMMARMAGADQVGSGTTTHDPACGSGRTLLAAAKAAGPLAAARLYTGMDVDGRCAKMAAINLALNGLCGWIVHGNSLSLELFSGWLVAPFQGANRPGMIRQIDPQQLVFRPKAGSDPAAECIPVTPAPLPAAASVPSGPANLFSAFE